MHRPSSPWLLCSVIAVAAAGVCAVGYISTGREQGRASELEHAATTSPRENAATRTAAMNKSVPAITQVAGELDREAEVAKPAHSTESLGENSAEGVDVSRANSLPKALVERAKTTSWDVRTSAALELFMLATFDADGNGVLDDLERIAAVRAMRDAVWPEQTAINASEVVRTSNEDAPDAAAAMMLSEEDRSLHRNVDEARRRERQEEGAAAGEIADDLRAELVSRFQIDDDGRLTVAEYSRYMVQRKAKSPAADLDGDGRVNDTDLRVFLDVASPIDGPIKGRIDAPNGGPINEP